ncbi:MAG: acyl-CoA thioesterase [Acidimicrobiales bacterium]
MDVRGLIDVVQVSGDGEDRFVGHSPADRTRSVYGGQFLAQALMAAAATVPGDRVPHSLHAYFVRAGLPQVPIFYQVERVRDGRNFSHRHVVARQEGKEVFRQLQSFHVPGPGPEHQEPFEVAAGTDPSLFRGYRDWVRELSDNADHAWFHEQLPVDLRFQDAPPARPRAALSGILRIWMRLTEAVPSEDPVLHAALLAWMSDKSISDVTMYPQGKSWTDADTDILSLDHAMWFYEPHRADAWTLFTHETPATGGGRGLARGDLVNLNGRRVGALAQEALLLTPAAQ